MATELENNYLRQINKEIYDYENTDIPIVPGLTFNQKDTIEQVYFYYLSKFKTGGIDTEGDKKYFLNINRSPCKVTTKMIDFDTKHIRIMSADGTNPRTTWYLERDLKHWMKEQNFGKTLNRIFQELPIFGSVVLKIIKGIPYFVDLRNFVINQIADTLDETPIIERHFYTADGLRKEAKKLGWENIEEAIKQYREMEKGKRGKYIMVFERYGEIATMDRKGNSKISNRRIVIADVGIDKVDEMSRTMTARPGVTLKDEEYNGHPYYEIHFEKIPGRWLGLGVVESLFDTQIRQNELANQMAKGTYWASLRLFQTSGDTNTNFARDVVNGQVLNNDGFPISLIDTAERNLAYFTQEAQKWMSSRDENTFTYDIPRGERSPAGTTLGEIQILANSAYNYFGQIQENVALDIKELLFKEIIPEFQRQNTKEHFLRLIGEDLEEMNNLLIDQKATNALFRFLLKKNKLPSKVQYDAMKAAIGEKVKKGNEKMMKIPKEFYKNLKYKIDIEITGESKDIRVWASVLFAALQALTTDPTLLQDPVKRKLFTKWMEQGGLNITDVDLSQSQDMSNMVNQMPARAGGGVSAPKMPQMPMAGGETTQL